MGALIISIVAVIVAIVIPIIIAYKQNKIALFDKRFKSFDVLQRYMTFASMVKDTSCVNNYESYLVMIIFDDDETKLYEKNFVQEIEKISLPLKHMPYLFKNINQEEIEETILELCRFSAAITANSDTEECKQTFLDKIEKFYKKHEEEICNTLKLNK